MGLEAGDLLLEDRRDQDIDDGLGAAHPDAREPAGELGDQRVDIGERFSSRTVDRHADDARRPLHGEVRAGPPRLSHESCALHPNVYGRRPGARPQGQPCPAGGQSDGSIAMAADERAKGLEEVERAIEWPRDGGHERQSRTVPGGPRNGHQTAREWVDRHVRPVGLSRVD